MAMSVLLHDAVALLGPGARNAYDRGDLADIVYADDTLLMGVSDTYVTEYLRAVMLSGSKYGMELHFGKFQLLPVRCQPRVALPDGDMLAAKKRMEYLGTVLTDDVHDSQELARRIAMAKADFIAIEAVWRHSSLTWPRKLHIFSALIESKLLYALAAICLTTAQKRKLNGFQNRCLRAIVGIRPSYESRVSNVEVLRKCNRRPATEILLERQLILFGKALRAPEGHPLRTASFTPGTDQPATNRYVRRQGRPCLEWIPEMIGVSVRIFGSMERAAACAASAADWKQAVNDFLK